MKLSLLATSFLLVSAANSQMFRPSKPDQLKAGKEYADKIRAESKILPATDVRVKLLRDLGTKLLATRTPAEIKREPWEFTFDVIDSKEVNAFAVPGGPIFFFTGLIDKMKTVDELAGVLGHEIIHVRREHWASSVNSAQEKSAILTGLGSIFGLSRDTMTIVDAVRQFGLDMPNGRGQERESDTFGFDSIVKAGFNPEGMALVFETFRSLKGSGSSPEFLSTHPDDKSRIDNIRRRVVEMGKAKTPVIFPALRPLPFETEAMRLAKNPPKVEPKKPGGV
jgi:beta-barrel assembly-enhancing protease